MCFSLQIKNLQYYLIPPNRTFGSNDLSICPINKTQIYVDLNPYYSDSPSANHTLTKLSKCYVGEKFDSIIMDPNSIAYDDYELQFGFESKFIIIIN